MNAGQLRTLTPTRCPFPFSFFSSSPTSGVISCKSSSLHGRDPRYQPGRGLLELYVERKNGRITPQLKHAATLFFPCANMTQCMIVTQGTNQVGIARGCTWKEKNGRITPQLKHAATLFFPCANMTQCMIVTQGTNQVGDC